MIDSVNVLSEPSQEGGDSASKGDDPLQQIGQILSSHLDSLQWIDGAVREVEGKVNDVEKRMRETSVASGVGTTSVSAFNTNGSRSRGFGLGR